MKLFLGMGTVIASLLAVSPQAIAQTCEIFDGTVPVNQSFMYDAGQREPAYINGGEPESRVNLRNWIGTDSNQIGYGVTGDFVWVAGQGFDSNCETWLYVHFPISNASGWMHSYYIELAYGRGFWD